MNARPRALPEELRVRAVNDRVKRSIRRPTVTEMIAFSRPDGGGRELFAAICDLERALIGSGHLDSDFAAVVARSKQRWSDAP